LHRAPRLLEGYHPLSKSVKKARRASRKSSSILRLRSCAGPSLPSSGSGCPSCSRK